MRRGTLSPFAGKVYQTMGQPSVPPHYTPDDPTTSHTGEAARTLAQDPYNDQLIAPHTDRRPVALRERAPVLVPQYNRFYDSQRTDQGWRYTEDIAIAVQGFVGPSGATVTAQTTLTMANPPNWRLEQWPGGVQLYLVLTQFNIAAETGISGGPLTIQFQGQGGGGPMNIAVYSTGGNALNGTFDKIYPYPLTDPGNANIGQLLFTQKPAGAAAPTLDFTISFSVAYLLPNLDGYTQDSIHQVLHHTSRPGVPHKGGDHDA